MIIKFGCWLVLLAVYCVAFADLEVRTDEIELDKNTLADNSSFQSDDCYCGIFSESCLYVGGKKICKCDDYYAGYRGTCTPCDCNGKFGCEFNSFGYKECKCPKGYDQLHSVCQKCDCGEHGSCQLYDFGKVCQCERGYKLKKTSVFNKNSGICEECDCGENGRCDFNGGYKECTCKTGFAENSGKCEDCNCSPGTSCTFKNGFDKECICPPGYADFEGQCMDIDECLKPEDNDCPPISTECVNTQGSYDCVCKEGFQVIYKNGYPTDIKEYGCKDIDECLDSSPCINLYTRCVNTPGSYRCECTEGYSLEKGKFGEKYNYCNEDARPWKTASIVVGSLYGFVSLGLLVAICTKHSN